MKPLITLLLLLTLLRTAGAKESKDMMRANFYYAHMAFHEAIPYFEKLTDNEKTTLTYVHLADCYRLTGDLPKAADNYAIAVNRHDSKDEAKLSYAQVLMEQGRYDDAEKWLQEYRKNKPKDVRAANLIAGCAMAEKMSQAIPEGVAIFTDINTEGSEFAPTLWKGKLVFASDTTLDVKKKTDSWTGKSYYNIYCVSCDDKGRCTPDYKEVAKGKEVNVMRHDGPCTFSADGRDMYFTRSRYESNFLGSKPVSNRDSVVLLEVVKASGYDEQTGRFHETEPFAWNSADYSVAYATVSPNGQMLVFSSNMPKGAGGADLYMCHKERNGDWDKPQNMGPAINTEGEEVFPWFADDKTLCFSSDGHAGLGGLDIYRSTWDDNTHAFSTPVNAGVPLNSSYDDISLAMKADGGSCYFSSNRPAAKGGDNIFFFKKEQVFLHITVRDSVTHQPIGAADIALAAPQDTRNLASDNSGQLFTRLHPDAGYNIYITHTGYHDYRLPLSATTAKERDTLLREVLLSPVIVQHDTALPVTTVEMPVVRRNRRFDSPAVEKYVQYDVYEIGHFGYEVNEYTLNSVRKMLLDSLVGVMKHHPTMRIEVQAHTDCRGSDEYNQWLSDARAGAVMRYLIQRGISPKRLESKGFGYRMPAIKCPDCQQCTEEEHYLNRVLEFKVLQL